MPTYDYKCSTCSRAREVFLKLADLNSPVYCQRCGHAMNRQLSAPFVRGDYAGYECPVTGQWIEGRRAHEENLKRTECRILEPGEADAYRKSLTRADEQLEKSLDDTWDGLVANLPTDKRDRLAGEIEGGLTTELVRSTPTNGLTMAAN